MYTATWPVPVTATLEGQMQFAIKKWVAQTAMPETIYGIVDKSSPVQLPPAAVAGRQKQRGCANTMRSLSTALPPTSTIFGPNVGRAILFHESKIIVGFLSVGRNTLIISELVVCQKT
jgi:hypothetical protein